MKSIGYMLLSFIKDMEKTNILIEDTGQYLPVLSWLNVLTSLLGASLLITGLQLLLKRSSC